VTDHAFRYGGEPGRASPRTPDHVAEGEILHRGPAYRRRVGPARAEVALDVQDYGRGIAVDQLPHLFARFYQVARADRPAQDGLGLGLFICEQLVAAHGGRITAASTEGHGTTFTVWLPLREGEGGTGAGRNVRPAR